jgi:hypothetical protein
MTWMPTFACEGAAGPAGSASDPQLLLDAKMILSRSTATVNGEEEEEEV